MLRMTPDLDQWAILQHDQPRLSMGDVIDLSRVATEGRKIAEMPMNGRTTPISLRFPEGVADSIEGIGSLPIGINGKLIPLKSLLKPTSIEAPPNTFRVNGQDEYLINGNLFGPANARKKEINQKAQKLVDDWMLKQQSSQKSPDQPQTKPEHKNGTNAPSVIQVDASKDITAAIEQLGMAVGASILLIFIVLLIQFGSLGESLLVLAAVPLGFLGVLVSLWLFRSTLSLNSVLGVILLNGIAVNNSIILVDFIKRLHAEGRSAREAAVEAARLRLRPILITSLTTILGMLPIALGFGEGGKILQPLGIAVSGGLWISMLLTLLLVPALHVAYLEHGEKAEKLS